MHKIMAVMLCIWLIGKEMAFSSNILGRSRGYEKSALLHTIPWGLRLGNWITLRPLYKFISK